MSERDCGSLIKQIHDEMEKRANNILRAQGLTMTQVSALLALYHRPEKEMPLKELEHALHVAQSTTAGIVSRLEQKGMVEGLGDSRDRRIKMVRLTPAGERCCENARQSKALAEEMLLSGLTEQERGVLFVLLQKVSNTFA